MAIEQNAKGSAHSPRLLEQVRNEFRFMHYSKRTEQSYVQWIKQLKGR